MLCELDMLSLSRRRHGRVSAGHRLGAAAESVRGARGIRKGMRKVMMYYRDRAHQVGSAAGRSDSAGQDLAVNEHWTGPTTLRAAPYPN